MITYDELMARRRVSQRHSYNAEMAQLYALGVGMGMDPRDERQIDFVLEDRMKVLPSFASVAVWDIEFKLELGVEWSKLIHASQRMQSFAPLPPSAELIADSRFVAAFDKPAINATLLISEVAVSDATSGERLAVMEHVSLARDFRVVGAPEGSPKPMSPPPTREPDGEVHLRTSPQVALIYRLLGGRSRIHSHPGDARAQGFDGPIMHGLSTWGHACHVILAEACDYDPARLTAFSADFKAPVYPGETLTLRLWHEGQAVYFEAIAAERGVLVLSNGNAMISTPPANRLAVGQ